MTPLGPAGVNARIAQIQAKLDALSPRPQSTLSPQPPAGLNGSFAATLNSVCPLSPMTGQISPLAGMIGGAVGSPDEASSERSTMSKDDMKTLAQATAERYGLDPDVFSALVNQESGWDPNAKSSAGAKGLCQLMDSTAKDLGVTNPYDPKQSLDGGARYLRQMLERFNGDTAKALAAYNAGPGFVAKHNSADWYHETKGYVKTILANSGAKI